MAEKISSCEPVDFLLRVVSGKGRISVAHIDPRGGAPEGRTYELPEESNQLGDWISSFDGRANLYYSVNEPVPTREQQGARGKLKESDISRIRGFAVDLDPVASAEEAPGGLERERQRLLAEAEHWKNHVFAEPTAIIDSGNGLQFVWLFDSLLRIEHATTVKALAKAFALKFGAGADSVHSLDHLFRIPETTNLPNARKRAKGRQPVRARMLALSGTRYAVDFLKSFAGVSAPVATEETDGDTISTDPFDYDSVLEAAADPSTLSVSLAEISDAIRNGSAALLDCGDRSSRDFALAMRCIGRGMSDLTDIARVVFALSPEKLLEKEDQGHGEKYARMTVARALDRNKSNLQKHFSPLDPENSGGSAIELEAPANPTRPQFSPLRIVDFPIERQAIPQRRWLAHPAIPQGEAVILVGPPKAAKSAWSVMLAVAVATGNKDVIFGRGPGAPWRIKNGRVLIVNNEDPTDEILRRIAAIVEATGANPARGSIAILSGADPDTVRLSVRRSIRGAPSERATGYGFLETQVRRFEPDLVIFDSLVSMGEGLSENDNAEMDQLVRDLRRIAALSGATALIVHHTSKGKADAAGDARAARGAGAIYGAIRAGFTLMPLTPEEIRKAGLPAGRYIRMDDSGGNYSAKDDRVHVWRLDQGRVGNGAPSTDDISNASEYFEDAARGDTAPVPIYVAALRMGGRNLVRATAATNETDADTRRSTVARAVYDAVMATGGVQAPLDRRMKTEIGHRLKSAGATRTTSIATIDKILRDTILAEGVRLETDGSAVRVYRRAPTGKSRSQIFVGFDEADSSSENASSENFGNLRRTA